MKNILCFGDSNTWGYNPHTKGRFSSDIRWTGRLQKKLYEDGVNVIEQGLCGRTTVFEDKTRANRRGINTLKEIFSESENIDYVILMLGTNDCKTYYGNTANEIAKGIEECLDIVLEHVLPEKVLLVSPIILGEEVWKDEFDPEFDKNSILVSKNLKAVYEIVAKEHNVNFLAASEFANPSVSDQEHMDEVGHGDLANAIFESVKQNLNCA